MRTRALIAGAALLLIGANTSKLDWSKFNDWLTPSSDGSEAATDYPGVVVPRLSTLLEPIFGNASPGARNFFAGKMWTSAKLVERGAFDRRSFYDYIVELGRIRIPETEGIDTSPVLKEFEWIEKGGEFTVDEKANLVKLLNDLGKTVVKL